jgi:TP901 family phage tail tape measure protein
LSDVNANIGINFDATQGLQQLRQLQAGLSRFNQSLTEGNVTAAAAQKSLNAQLMQAVNATGKFVASQKTVAASTTAFTDALEKNKFSLKEYFRYTAAAASANTKVLSNMFAQEREIINRARKDRVKSLQTQYIQLTNAQGDLVKVLQVVPKHLEMVNGKYTDYATRVQMAAQRQQLLNQLIKQGSTQLLNFGKNTQWAGRQLMVGLTVPLTMLGSFAAQTFKDMEMAVVKFSRVYGDMFTSNADTNKAVEDIKKLGMEFTKYGVAVKDTITMAADAAAMGLTGNNLLQQVSSANKLAVLGQVEQQQALETTISLQNAFGISSDQLAAKINFLNSVENQTVLSISDLTTAIPKAGPVVKQLGGSVEDLAVFMTAMKEGGINASEGANALKSGLASLINPTKKASEMLAGFGINIKGIVEANAGNLKGTVVAFAQALDTLDPLNRARAIEQLFGKFQFARLSTLFQNIVKDGSQASKALDLAGASVEELAILSERELGKVENAVTVKYQKSIEQLKVQLAPVGKAFLQAVTPIVQFFSKVLEKFNSLGEGTKKTIAIVTGVLAGIAPVALMTFGLLANGAANIIKLFGLLRGGMAKLNGQNSVLGGGFDYLTQAEIENLAQSNALHTSHQQLIETFNVEASSLNQLAAAYSAAASQARNLASANPGVFNTIPGATGAVKKLPKYADGILSVPGPKGAGDVVPAMLSPGETVVPAKQSEKHRGFLAAIIGDKVPGFKKGRYDLAGRQSNSAMSFISSLPDISETTRDYLINEFGRIEKLTESQIAGFAKVTGTEMADNTKESLEKVRNVIRDSLKNIVLDAKKQSDILNEESINKVGKAYDPNLKSYEKGQVVQGSTRMGQYAPKINQPYRTSFAHVGQTEIVRPEQALQAQLTPDARKQVELVEKFYAMKGKAAPDLRLADAHAFSSLEKFNNVMSVKGKAAAYEKKNGPGSLGIDFTRDFEQRGVSKWKDMTDILGKDF